MKHSMVQKLMQLFAPFHLFKDCSRGSAEQRWSAYRFNQENAWRLKESMKNCLIVFLGSLLGVYGLESLVEWFPPLVYGQMCLGISCSLFFVGLVVQVVMYGYFKHVKVTLR